MLSKTPKSNQKYWLIKMKSQKNTVTFVDSRSILVIRQHFSAIDAIPFDVRLSHNDRSIDSNSWQFFPKAYNNNVSFRN